jgi:hypothetical protein
VNSLIFGFHCCVVFGIPSLFGWVVLRQVFRETNWLALLSGSVLIGLAALMATMNEVRYFAEMGPAAWFTYKILFGLAILLMVVLPRRARRPRLPGCVDRGWKLILLLLATIAVSFYYGVPAFGGYLDDAWWGHYPAAVQIQTTEKFPLSHMFALDGPLFYHHGPDILAACWSYLLDRPVQIGFALNIAILAPCAFLMAFALLARLARNYWSAFLGAAFLIAGGNLRFLLFLTGQFKGVGGALQVFNSHSVQSLLQLIFTPSHALGVPLVLTVVLLLRHMQMRPSWLIAATLGLLLGSLTLVAEWYFLPLLGGVSVTLLLVAWRRRSRLFPARKGQLILAVLPTAVAVFWGSFNNTYLSGMFGYYWMHYDNVEQIALARQYAAKFRAPSALAPEIRIYRPKWSPPDLIPLRFNFAHFGQVPSWKSTASDASSYIPIFGGEFLMEAAPVLLVGIPFGLWLSWRQRNPIVFLLAWLAVVSTLPPIFLDWGYRSADFLRFFTAAYSIAALFLGWLAGLLLTKSSLRQQLCGGGLAACCLITPIGLGVVGLMPDTVAKVTAIASTAGSLSDISTGGNTGAPGGLAAQENAARHQAFERLAADAGDFLFILTKGRDRVIVVVPPDEVPKTQYFPEWMKMATLSRILLPVGWHWENSLYSAYYRDAVLRLDSGAIAALDAKWVIVSDVFQDKPPAAVEAALRDRARFAPAAAFREGRYVMTIYRVLP